MDHTHAPLRSAKYLTMERAEEESGFSSHELTRAMTLGLISTAEIGNSVFIERLSLEKYAAQEEKGQRQSTFSNSITSSIREQENFFVDEDHHSDPKERALFHEALVRDKTMSSLLSPMPYVSVIAIAFIALILALPTPSIRNTSGVSELATFSSENIKDATLQEIYAFFSYASEASDVVARGFELSDVPKSVSEASPRAYSNQRASVLEAWLGSTSKALGELALGVYRGVNSLLGIE